MKRFLCLVLTVLFFINCFTVCGFAAGSITGITAADPVSNSFSLAVYQSRKLYINVSPKSASKNVSWSVADKKIASVSSDGVVTGKKEGKTKVTVSSTDGSKKSLTYSVTVKARKEGNNASTKSCTIVNTDNAKYTYERLTKDLKNLKKSYPYILDYVSLGKSYDDRDIYEVILGNKDSKNRIIVQATVHAREYINSLLVMKQVEALCANYYTGTYRAKYYSELLDNCCFYIIPMMNPDGVAISIKGADGIKDDTLRAKVVKKCNKYGDGKSSYYKTWKANARGVDLNRNWDCNWRTYKNGSSYACSSGYKGSAPNSEKETKILKKEVETLKPKVVISYHSNGEMIYWDLIQSGSLQRKCNHLFKEVKGLTGYSSAENPSAHGGKVSDLTPCFGDWVANAKKTPTLTIETGNINTACPIPVKYFPTIWKQNKHVLPAVAYFALNDTAISIASLKAVRKGFSLTANPSSKKDLTYLVSYSLTPDFKNAVQIEIPASDGKLKVKKLKANKKYYVRMRTIKKYGKIKIYSRWSEVKTVRTKK